MEDTLKSEIETKIKERKIFNKCDIAVVGIACKLPGAENYLEYWDNLIRGVNSISEIPKDRWDTDKYFSTNIEDTNKTMSKWGGVVDGIDKFDNRFFNISPREAKNMDPQQRLLVEEMWHCIEDSGIPLPELQQKKTSIYIGVMASDYHQEASSSNVIVDSYAGLGNYDCILANRISYLFDLKGVSVAVDAACASSLVAIHEARYSLIMEESDYAIAGGVNLTCHPWKYISFSKSRMLSPDGQCKTFDKDANGYVPGEGIAVILLQRLEDAQKTGSHIYGLIKGSAVNHGGKTKSITAPRVESQQDVILSAYKDAAIDPNTVTYVEAHGTGTSLGDPIEVEALTKAFYEYFPLQLDAQEFEKKIISKLTDSNERTLFKNLFRKDNRNHSYRFIDKSPHEIKEYIREILLQIGFLKTGQKQFCSLGSVKTNIGHLEAAAGIAGVIKILMMMRAKKIPMSLNVQTLNPIINFKETPFKVALEIMDWKPRYPGLPLRASVSSFGFGGVNAHAVIEEYRDQRVVKRSQSQKEYLFTLSAKSPKSLEILLNKWKQFIHTPAFNEDTLYDICTTLVLGRSSMPYRYGFVIRDKKELISKLQAVKGIYTTGTDKPYCLRIGNVDWSGMSDIKTFMLKTTSFSLHLSALRKYFDNNEADEIFNELFRNERIKTSEALYSFLIGYAFLCTLRDFGFEPDMVAAEGSGVLLAIVFCGFISIDDGIGLLCKRKQWKEVTTRRPAIPYYDSVLRKTAMPFHFDGKYLGTLIDEMLHSVRILGEILVDRSHMLSDEERVIGKDKPLRTLLGAILIRSGAIDNEKLEKALAIKEEIDEKLGDVLVKHEFCTQEKLDDALRLQAIIRHLIDGVLDQYVNKAKMLNTSQFTFKKFLEEWNVNLKKYNKNITILLEDTKRIHQESGFIHKEKLLMMIIIVSSLRKLNQKWDLSEHKLMEEERFFELIELVVDGVIPRESVVDLLLSEDPDYDEIAHTLNRRQRIIREQMKKSYTLIKTFYPNIEEVPDKSTWFEKAVNNKDTLNSDEIAYCKKESIQFVQLGTFHKSPPENEVVQLSVQGEFSNLFKEDLLLLWNYGVDVKWHYLYQGVRYNKVALPVYPFDKLSFWLPRLENQEHVDRITREEQYTESKLVPRDNTGLRYSRIFTEKDDILRDHVINHLAILPGAAMVEAGLEAAMRASRQSRREVKKLTEIIIHNPAILKGRVFVNIEIDRRQCNFQIKSGSLNLCEGKYNNDPVAGGAGVDFSDIINSDLYIREISNLYTSFTELGYQYGENLQVIGSLWKRDNRFIFELNKTFDKEGGVTQLSPFLLDGAFQAALAVQYSLEKEDPGSFMYLPYFIKSLTVYDKLIDLCFVSFYESDIRKKGDALTVNIAVYNEGGKLVLLIQDMIFRKVERSLLFKGMTGTASDIHYYQPVWKERALIRSTTDVQRKIAILFTGDENLDTVLREVIINRYQEVFYIQKASEYRKESRNFIFINPDMEYDFQTALSEIFLDLDGHYNGCDLYYLWPHGKNREIRTSGDLIACQADGIRSLFYIFRTLAGRRINGTIDTVLVTSDAHIVKSGDTALGYVYGGFSGFARTLMIEIPKLRIKWIDFASGTNRDMEKAQLLFEEIRSSKLSEHIAYRDGKRFVREAEPVLPDDTARDNLLKTGKVYLLAGGAGGIGLKIARYITEQVKGVLILIGRRPPDHNLEKELEELKSKGSTVEYLQADLANYEQLNGMVREIKKRHGVINGVIHTGGVLDDKLITGKQWSECWQVMASKVLGAWNLNNITQNESLDFFTVFASIVGVIGNAGQVDYAAANSFLDAFIHWRRKSGFPGRSLSIDWTLWVDGGMGAGTHIQDAFAKRSGVIHGNQGPKVFHQLLNNQFPQVVVAGKDTIINAGYTADPVPEAPADSMHSRIVQKHKTQEPAAQEQVAAILAEIIQVKAADLNLHTDLREYGLDSVGFTELSEKINSRLQTSVNPTLFFEYPTLKGITGYLLENYKHLNAAETPEIRSEESTDPNNVEQKAGVSVSAEDIKTHISSKLTELLASVIQIDTGSLEINTDIREYGMDSVGFTEYSEKINKELNTAVNPTVFFEFPTISALTVHLTENYPLGAAVPASRPVPPPEQPASVRITENTLQARVSYVISQLITLLSRIIEVEKESLDVNTDIREYGMDSLGFTELSEKINKELNTAVNPTVFFEYPTIDSLANYLIDNYKLVYQEETIPKEAEKLEQLPFNLEKQPVMQQETRAVFNMPGGRKPESVSAVFPGPVVKTETPASVQDSEVAIVGISGRFPGADNLKEFWENMAAGKDAVTLIPEDRWDWQEVFGDPQGDENKTNSKWGGFLSDIRRFDAKFFKISPREAECMDPQQRLLIEEVWHALEDAGCRPSSLADTKTGVFIGVCNDDYNELLVRNNVRMDAFTSTGSYFSIIANRISYLLNIHGPSLAVDTACSSALVAIQQAVQSIRSGDCEMALAGGVNICCTPRRYISFSNAGMLSPDGRCKTFDKQANGYVRGEGVGVLFLKPLKKALADGNRIYGIIKGVSVNHGGFSTSLTAPSPNAQAELIIDAYARAGFDPSTISYIETGGTGTSLGDPIEINGLKKAFKELFNRWGIDGTEKPYCGISSVKTYIGHLESAGGIAGIIKLLLSMKHRLLLKLLHFTEKNPYIELNGTPFYFVTENSEWQRLKDEAGNPVPRRAGVSSFGFGGVNAHVVIEEYIPPVPPLPLAAENSPAIIVLSAKTDERLKVYARNLVQFLETEPLYKLHDIAFTLQNGRTPMEERLAVLAGDRETLKKALTEFYQGKIKIHNLFRGNISDMNNNLNLLVQGRAGAQFLKTIIEDKELDKIAQLWSTGVDFDWKLIYPDAKPVLVPLPGYPFGGEKYWIENNETGIAMKTANRGGKRLHLLVESNASTLHEQKFTTHFYGNEFFLADHIVAGQKVLPGVAYIEMVRAAGELAGEQQVKAIKHMVWMNPVIVNGLPREISINFYPEQGKVSFEVNSKGLDNHKLVHCQGKLLYDGRSSSEHINLERIRHRCAQVRESEECYRLFARTGLDYGKSFQGIRELHYNDREGLALLKLPSQVKKTSGEFMLHPSLMDSALQTILGITGEWVINSGATYLPFSMDSVEIFTKLPESCYAYAKADDAVGNKGVLQFDVKIADDTGKVLVEMHNFTLRAWKQPGPEDGIIGKVKAEKPKLTDAQVLELLHKLQAGELDPEQADRLIGGYYVK